MASLGYDPTDTTRDTTTPRGVGNVAAQAVLDFRRGDGANQLGDLHPGAYSDYTRYGPTNDAHHIHNPDRWQSLEVADGHGGTVTQTYIAPHWGLVVPFALGHGAQLRPAQEPAHDGMEAYREQVRATLQLTRKRILTANAIYPVCACDTAGCDCIV